MINYEEKKNTLLKQQDFRCASCNKTFKTHEKIDLAHGIKAGKKNYLLFSEYVIDHIINLSATHSGKCNDKCNMSRAAHPIKAQERIIDIISTILMDDPSIFIIKRLHDAFDNIGSLVTQNVVSISQYEILENFFEHYEEM